MVRGASEPVWLRPRPWHQTISSGYCKDEMREGTQSPWHSTWHIVNALNVGCFYYLRMIFILNAPIIAAIPTATTTDTASDIHLSHRVMSHIWELVAPAKGRKMLEQYRWWMGRASDGKDKEVLEVDTLMFAQQCEWKQTRLCGVAKCPSFFFIPCSLGRTQASARRKV